MKYCKKCLTPETRPRVNFNENGVCNACEWAEKKKNEINWKERWSRLENICDEYRDNNGDNWDVIVPCSGGKDGSYVAWKLKHELGMHPLTVTFKPQAQTELGRENLNNFINSGFDHIMITPNPKVYNKLAIKGFKEQGRPKMPFVMGISTAIIRLANHFDIPFIMYGEDGEVEYGGAKTQYKTEIDRDYLVKYYYSGHDPKEFLSEFNKHELKWWLLPSEEEIENNNLFATHWSNFENWDPKKHAELAKDKCGLQTLGDSSIGTFTDYAQLDDKLQDLHAYLMFVKFGFGRATSDVNIEIRADRMTRDKGLEYIKKYDGDFPEEYLDFYLDYFNLSEKEFWDIVDSHANKDVLKNENGKWILKEEPK